MVEKKNDTHILQGRCEGERKKETGNVAIAVNLYYEESMLSYLKYLSGVPSEIDVYIFSSNLNVLEELKDKYSNSANIFILKKARHKKKDTLFQKGILFLYLTG